MNTEKFLFTGAEGKQLPAFIWIPEKNPRMILQFTHGMTEHIARYSDFAESLAEEGIITAGFDLRGHGENPGDRKCASFGEGGWDLSIQDMHIFFEIMKSRFPDLPHTMMGFSLGSFLLRDYLSRYDDNISAVILSGTGNQPPFVMSALKMIAKSQIKKAGFDNTTALVNKMLFETYNQKFRPNRTRADWLCADENAVDNYLGDELCRESISSGLFYQLMDSIQRVSCTHAHSKWNKNTPVCLVCGNKDPVGNFGRGAKKFYTEMKKDGIKNIEFHLIENARHDLLHENKNGKSCETISIIKNFLKN